MRLRATLDRLVTTALLSGIMVALGLATTAGAEPERAADGAVVVRASGATADGIGAGTIVGLSGTTVTVITAKHVAEFGSSLSLRFSDGSRADAHVAKLIAGRDLALVSADVDPALAATLHVAPIGQATRNLPVHVWGSGNDGPAFEPAAVNAVGTALPDGAARERYTISCTLCHQGDSGAGVFDAHGRLVGVYVGFFVMETGRLSVAEEPLDSQTLAADGVANGPNASLVASR